MAFNCREVFGSGSVHGNFSFTWMIEDFSTFDWENEEHFESKCFQIEKNETGDWCLRIYPGEKLVICHLLSFEPKIVSENVKCSLSFRNSAGGIVSGSHPGEDFLAEPESVCSEVIVTHASKDECPTFFTDLSTTANLIKDMYNLSVSKDTADAVISINGTDIPVHTLVLGARCKVLADIFNRDCQGKDSMRVEITDFEVSTVKSLVQFIYVGLIEKMDVELALELLRAADKYNMSDLKTYSSNYLIPQIYEKNVLRLLVSADMYMCDRLRKYALIYFLDNQRHVDIDSNRSTLNTRPDLLCCIIKAMIMRTVKK